MKAFLGGLILGGILLIVFIFVDNSKVLMYLLLVIGIVPIVISGFITGAFASGDRVRANYSNSDNFYQRSNIGTKLFLFGIPCLVAGIAIYFI